MDLSGLFLGVPAAISNCIFGHDNPRLTTAKPKAAVGLQALAFRQLQLLPKELRQSQHPSRGTKKILEISELILANSRKALRTKVQLKL